MRYEIKRVKNHTVNHLDWLYDIVFFKIVKCDKCLNEHKEYYNFEDVTGIVGYDNAVERAEEVIEEYELENFTWESITDKQLEKLQFLFEDEVDKVIALAIQLDLSYEEVLIVEIDKWGSYILNDDREYLVLTDEEANDLERERVSDLVEDHLNQLKYTYEYGVWKENKLFASIEWYIDTDKMTKDWIRDSDRGQTISNFNGEELEQYYNETYYYIYRTN